MSSRPTIHPTAIVEPGAEFGPDVYIGPYCMVGAQVKLGARTRLLSHVVIEGLTQIGEDNVIYPFTVIGAPPQDLTYKNEPTRVHIGDRNIIREQNTIHRGTAAGRGLTEMGSDNFIMATCHLAHDTITGNHVLMANQCGVAGHCQIEDYAYVGGQTAITQFCRIGAYSFIGANSVIRHDLPPYMMAKDFSEVSGPNLIGLKRRGISEENIRVARSLYKILYLENQRTEDAVQSIRERFPQNDFVTRFLDFVKNSKVGIQR